MKPLWERPSTTGKADERITDCCHWATHEVIQQRVIQCLPLSPLLFWLPPSAVVPAECPGRCFLTCDLWNNRTEHKCYYSNGPGKAGPCHPPYMYICRYFKDVKLLAIIWKTHITLNASFSNRKSVTAADTLRWNEDVACPDCFVFFIINNNSYKQTKPNVISLFWTLCDKSPFVFEPELQQHL